MNNANAIAKILLAVAAEAKKVKRNANGKPNGNSVCAMERRNADALIDLGESRKDAYAMVREVAAKFL